MIQKVYEYATNHNYTINMQIWAMLILKKNRFINIRRLHILYLYDISYKSKNDVKIDCRKISKR